MTSILPHKVESIPSTCAGQSIGMCRSGSAPDTPTECETLSFGVGEALAGTGSRRCIFTSIGNLPSQ